MATEFNGTTRAGEEHVVIFQLSNGHYALDIQVVQEIVRIQPITIIPGPEPWVEGITNLRGRVVPVLELRRRCDVVAAEHTTETRIVVVASLNGLVGLVVDAVSEVVRIPAADVESPSRMVSAPQNSYLRGVAKLEERLISLLDLEELIPSSAVVTSDSAVERLAA